jgi:ornithine carbamoyltransferase
VCNTWLQAAEVLDFQVHVSTPPGYEVEPERAGCTARITLVIHGRLPCGADLVTTDVWTSMGFEAENEERMRDFADWQVDADMMRVATRSGVHALPAGPSRRGSIAEVIDGLSRWSGTSGKPSARAEGPDGIPADRQDRR